MKPWVQYLIAFIVFCHGYFYLRTGLALPWTIVEWKESSWPLPGAVTGKQRAAIARGLHVVAGIVMLACSVAMAFSSALPGLWLAIVGAALGVGAFVVFWDGQGQTPVNAGAIGARELVLAPGRDSASGRFVPS
jgi:hypothetical protein